MGTGGRITHPKPATFLYLRVGSSPQWLHAPHSSGRLPKAPTLLGSGPITVRRAGFRVRLQLFLRGRTSPPSWMSSCHCGSRSASAHPTFPRAAGSQVKPRHIETGHGHMSEPSNPSPSRPAGFRSARAPSQERHAQTLTSDFVPPPRRRSARGLPSRGALLDRLRRRSRRPLVQMRSSNLEMAGKASLCRPL